LSDVLLGQIADIQAGPFGTQLHSSDYVKSGIPMLNAKNIGQGVVLTDSLDFVSEEICKKLPQYLLQEGDIVFGRAGSIERHTYISKLYANCFQGTNCIRVRCKDSGISQYISYYLWLPNIKKQILFSAGKTTLAYLNSDVLRMIPIQIADPQSCNEIVNILSSLDQKIAVNNEINTELEKLAKTLYNYWFVQFDFPNAKGKPYRAIGGKMEYSEILKREIPKGWEVKRFSDLATITTGKEDANFSTPKGKYNFFTCGREILRCDTPAFNGKAVLLAGNGDFNVKHYSGEFNAYQRTYVLIPKEHAYYASMYIAANDKVAELKKGAYGSIVKFITMSDVENIALPVSEGHISLFEKLNDIIIKIELLEQENSTLIELRDFLLPLLMNGQVRVGNEK